MSDTHHLSPQHAGHRAGHTALRTESYARSTGHYAPGAPCQERYAKTSGRPLQPRIRHGEGVAQP